MITPAAGAGTPLWAVLLFAVLGGLLGLRTGRVLATGGYRIDSDRAGGRRPTRPWWPAPALAGLWAFLAWRIGDTAGWAALPAYLLFGWLAVVLVWVDVDVRRLPDGMVLPAYPALLALLTLASLGAGDWRPLLGAAAAMAALYALYFVLALVSPASLGYGDVKLSGLIGLVLGWLGAGPALLGVVAGFVAGGVIAVVMLALQRVGLRSHIAFGPAMLAGAVAALALDYRVLPG